LVIVHNVGLNDEILRYPAAHLFADQITNLEQVLIAGGVYAEGMSVVDEGVFVGRQAPA
jgi:hypothetical protein